MKKVLTLAVLAGFALTASSAMACTLSNWTSTSGAVAAGDPSADSIARYSGTCGMAASATGYVQDDSPSAEARVVTRFYVLDGLTGSGDVNVFRAYSDAGAATPVITVAFDGADFTFTTPGGSTTVAANDGKWNSVEIDWQSGGNMSISMNGGAATTVAAGTGTIETVRFGIPDGMGTNTGTLTFDAYEMHRSTAVGRLICADATGDSVVNAGDLTSVVSEILGTLAVGQPDCTEDGTVNAGDLTCVVNTILGSPTCP